jgi:uncharacterized protein (TIGR00730 family)
MHARKAMMLDLADAAVALPGGSGTLDELFEAFTWAQLGFHTKPLGVLEVAGYWRLMLEFLDHAVEQRLLRAEHRDALIVEESPATMLDRLRDSQYGFAPKWLDRR